MRELALAAVLASCVPGPGGLDAGESYQLPRGVWNIAMTQDGDDVSVFTLERNFVTGLAEVGYGTWTPSGGFSPRIVFGEYSAKFGASVDAVPRGARLVGLSDFRKPDERIVTRNGIQLFRGQEIGLSCEGTQSSRTAVYPDGGAMLAKTARDNCGPLHCYHIVLMSTNVDGGRSCPLAGLDETEVSSVLGGSGLIQLHPSLQVASLDDVIFFEWGSDGQRLRHVSDAGYLTGVSPFWPTTLRYPTRVSSTYSTKNYKQYDPSGIPYYYTWESAGVVRYETPFSQYMHRVDVLTEVPTGVIVGGMFFTPDQPNRQESIGVLVDTSGTQALGTFLRRRDGRSGAPNVYVEGQYFLIQTWQQFGPDDRFHGYAEIEQFDLVPIEP